MGKNRNDRDGRRALKKRTPGAIGIFAAVVFFFPELAAAAMGDVVWVDDSLPEGANPVAANDAWNWVTNNPAPCSGTKAVKTNLVPGPHQIFFDGAWGMGPAGDKLFCHVYLDPVNTPKQVLLQWHELGGDWTRAYWGTSNLLTWPATKIGDLPPSGKWVKLEASAKDLRLKGAALDGFAFSLFDGCGAFDKAGSSGVAAAAPSYFAGGVIHLIQEAHQDIGWEPIGDLNGSIETDARTDVRILDATLDRMKISPQLTFMWEDMIGYEEYLKYQPTRVKELHERINEGRLTFGMAYTQPCESSLSSEQLMRQIYFGRRWFKKLFPARDTRIIYNFDVPARSMQMAQIVRKSGGKYIAASRHYGRILDSSGSRGIPDNAVMKWHSPDGSQAILWSCPHYCGSLNGYMGPAVDINNVGSIKKHVDSQQGYYVGRGLPKHLVLLYSQDYRPPEIYDKQIVSWNGWAETNGYPRMKYSSYEEALDALAAGADANPAFDSTGGERPNLWLYELGVNNEPIITLQREAAVSLPAAEAFSTFRALEEGSFASYPAADLDAAWRLSTTADHSIQHNKNVLPAYTQMYGSARDTGQKVFESAAGWLAKRVNTRSAGVALTVFNALGWQRSDPVVADMPPGVPSPVALKDAAGASVPFQLTADNKLVFIARDVPSFGYKTYYLVAGGAPPKPGAIQGKEWTTAYENDDYVITPSKGCLKGIRDKALARELFSTNKFQVADLLDLYSPGNGAGNHALFQYPSSAGYDKASNYAFTWTCVEDGAVRTVFTAQQIMKHYTYKVRLIVYNTLKRIDIEPTIESFDGTHERELRLMFPVNTARHDVYVDVPFGVQKIGASECNPAYGWGPLHQPREAQNFMCAGGEGFGVTVSTSVLGMDYMDPTDRPAKEDVIQPILFASRQQEGAREWWEQRGTHRYHFSIYSHAPGYVHGYRLAMQSNNPLLAIAPGSKAPDAKLPESGSLCGVSPSNLVISAIKKAEDDNGVLVRLYDVEGVDCKDVNLSFRKNPTAAWKTDLIEGNPTKAECGGATVSLPVGHHAIEAVKVTFEEETKR